MNPSAQNIHNPNRPKHIMIVAGEVSGDAHAAALVQSLKTLNKDLTFSGLGGPKMKKAGVHIDEDLTQFAVVGFLEILKHYWDFKRCFNLFLANVRQRQPAGIILVDYPGFNLRLAARLKSMGVKIFYYISPQVWAWKENRVAFIKKNIDHMLVLFEFEKDFYAKRGVNVDFVGHPLADKIHITADRAEVLSHVGLAKENITIGLLPGSRQKEIESLLPVMLDAATDLYQSNPSLQFLLLKAEHLEQNLYEKFLTNRALPLKIQPSQFYEGLNACDVCIVASGTATLETALLLKPMVVIYKTSLFTFVLAKALIKIPYIGLVNIVAGRKIVAECIQDGANASAIARAVQHIYQNPSEISRIRHDLEKVKSSLGAGGASKQAAEKIYQHLH